MVIKKMATTVTAPDPNITLALELVEEIKSLSSENENYLFGDDINLMYENIKKINQLSEQIIETIYKTIK
jgi:hypothetical protein